MLEAKPSRTAMRVAMHRAAHQLFDRAPRVLEDPVAVPIIGAGALARLQADADQRDGLIPRAMRAFMVARSRFAEDELVRAIGRGATQYVVLGAGLDTFAYRRPASSARVRVFEVDHPSTQAWKRSQLAAASIAIPADVTFAPVDFERETLADGLAQAGFDRSRPAFFSWLGVTIYLTEEAIVSTLTFVASTPRGGGLVFDYAVPPSSVGVRSRLAFNALAGRVAAAGEPFRTHFDPVALHDRLTSLGFHSIADLGSDEMNARYFVDRADGLRLVGFLGRVLSAEV
jgi:methyltransferase (TIGR00027 family)